MIRSNRKVVFLNQHDTYSYLVQRRNIQFHIVCILCKFYNKSSRFCCYFVHVFTCLSNMLNVSLLDLALWVIWTCFLWSHSVILSVSINLALLLKNVLSIKHIMLLPVKHNDVSVEGVNIHCPTCCDTCNNFWLVTFTVRHYRYSIFIFYFAPLEQRCEKYIIVANTVDNLCLWRDIYFYGD